MAEVGGVLSMKKVSEVGGLFACPVLTGAMVST